MKFLFHSQQAAGNITPDIPRLRSGSVRLNNFVSQNYSLTDLSPIHCSRLLTISEFRNIPLDYFLIRNVIIYD